MSKTPRVYSLPTNSGFIISSSITELISSASLLSPQADFTFPTQLSLVDATTAITLCHMNVFIL